MCCNNFDKTNIYIYMLKIPYNDIGQVLGLQDRMKVGRVKTLHGNFDSNTRLK